MKKFVKAIIIVAVVLVVLIGAYMIGTGFRRAGGIAVMDYQVNDKTMTMKIANCNSIGYVRTLKPERQGSIIVLNPYYAFGGVNGSIGAKDVYDIDVSGADEIYMMGADGNDKRLVFEKVDGEWVSVNAI